MAAVEVESVPAAIVENVKTEKVISTPEAPKEEVVTVTEEVKEGAKDAAPEENAVEPDPEAEKAVEAQKETVVPVEESVEEAAVVAPEEPAAVVAPEEPAAVVAKEEPVAEKAEKEEVEEVKKEAAVEETKEEEFKEVKKEAEVEEAKEETPGVVEAAAIEVAVDKTEE
ncbi:unnamed protein product [Fraxinus pennsylvanica]|uniref:Uncharacterized protein n=1 Tax=Fraxinus pennsylvanica TaxID=56036 RepID=A0AAD2DPZ7_9LAMI|nr:unnamed protein product [Fraxinus pennsylvanica]